MTLTKAKLIPKDNGVHEIEFMFNPTELSFEKVVETSENQAARTQDRGQNKVSFATTISYKVTINKILFDTYETGEDVVKKYIDHFRKAVQFDPKLVQAKKERTPLYTFAWGSHQYLRSCFIEKLSYKLTMFLPDGTPVRAVIDSLSLKEADEPKPNIALGAPKASQQTRQQDTMQNKRNGKSGNNANNQSRSNRKSRQGGTRRR